MNDKVLKMIKFDSTKITCDYVYIKKITQNYIYVVSDINLRLYKPKNYVRGTYLGQQVTKIPVHGSVTNKYFKTNSVKEFFGKGRLATISYYDGSVLNIESQRINFKTNTFDTPETWKSAFEMVISKINNIVPKNVISYINGDEIIWEDETRGLQFIPVNNDGSFRIRYMNYLNISKMGVKITKSQTDSIDDDQVIKDSDDDLKESGFVGLDNSRTQEDMMMLNFGNVQDIRDTENLKVIKEDAVAFIHSGEVLSYNPMLGTSTEKNFWINSPILFKGDKKSGFKKEKDNKKAIMSLIDDENPSYLNIDFALKAATIIGERYGHDETDILDIPKIIVETGVLSFHKINKDSRLNCPISLPVFEGLSWIYKFIHNETELDKIRDLCKLFKFTIESGLVYEKNITVKFKEGMCVDNIPLSKLKINRVNKVKEM
jgi:hypothetical protein